MPDEEDLRGFEWYWLLAQAHTWSAPAPPLRLSLLGHRSHVYHVTFSADGKQVATASADGTAQVWDAGSGQELLCLRGHKGDVNWVSLSNDCRRLATAGDDGTFRLWDRATGHELDHFAAQAAEASGAEFTPDGKYLACCSSDGTLWLWDLTTGQRRRLHRHVRPLGMPRLSRDGRHLIVVGGGNPCVLYLCDLATMRMAAEFTFPDGPHYSGGAAISTDGCLVASTDSSLLRLHTVPSLQQVMEAPLSQGSTGDGPALSPGGGMLACPTRDGRVELYGTAFRVLLGQWQAHNGRTWSLAFSPDGRTLATTGNNGEVKLWSLRQLPLAEQLRQIADFSPVFMLFGRDGKTLALGGWLARKACAGIWDLEQGRLRAALAHHDVPRDLALSADGKTLVTVTGDGTIYTWDMDRASLRSPPLGPSPTHSVALSPDGTLLAALRRDQASSLWAVPPDRPLWKLELAAICDSAAFSPNGTTLAAGDRAGNVSAWSVPTGGLRQQWIAHAAEVVQLRFSPDGQTLATRDRGIIKLWNGLSGECRHTLLGHRPRIRDLAFAPDGRTLASAGQDGTVRFWHVATGRELFHLSLFSADICGLTFSPDGATLAAIANLNGPRVFTLNAAPR